MYGLISVVCIAIIIVSWRRLADCNRWIWFGWLFVAEAALWNGTSFTNLIMFVVYALVLLACLQIRDSKGHKWLAYFIAVQTVAVVIMVVISPSTGNGGFLDPANYSLASAVILMAFMLSYHEHKWLLAPFVVIALVFTSSEEAIIWLVVLGVLVLIRRDWSKRIIPAVVAVCICLICFFGFHQPQYLYMISSNQVAELQHKSMPYQTDSTADPTRGRASGYSLALNTISVLGHKMDLTWTTSDTIHDVPLRVLYDVGIVGLLGLILAVAVSLLKGNIYVGAMLLAMMVFDHFLWTQIGVWLWAMLGLSYGSTNRYFFKH